MTKPWSNNLKESERRIVAAMESDKKYVLLPREGYPEESGWYCLEETAQRLRQVGFSINKNIKSREYYAIEWDV